MTETTRNRRLFYRIAAELRANPTLYDQVDYGYDVDCGTAHCIGGYAADLSGYRPHPEFGWAEVRHPVDHLDGYTDSIAADLLGLTGNEADVLFDADWIPAGVTNEQRHHPETLARLAATAMERLGDGATVASVTHTSHRRPAPPQRTRP